MSLQDFVDYGATIRSIFVGPMNMELKPKQKVTEMKVLPYIKSGQVANARP